MALGNRSGFSDKTMYILKLKSKDAEGKNVDPYFQVLEKTEEGWKPRAKTENNVSGRVFKVEPKTSTFNGDEIKSVSVYLNDGDEVYLIDLRYTMLARSILNSLLSVDDFSQEVEIGLYRNKKDFPAASVRANGDVVNWKFNIAELPQPKKVTFKGKEMSDFTEVDDFFQKEVESFSEKVKEANKSQFNDKPVSRKPVEKDPVLDEGVEDDGFGDLVGVAEEEEADSSLF